MDTYEKKIATKLIEALLEAKPDTFLAVHDSEEFTRSLATRDVSQLLADMASTDMDKLYIVTRPELVHTDYLGWVLLVWGNGRDLISNWYPGSDASWLSRAIDPVLSTLDD